VPEADRVPSVIARMRAIMAIGVAVANAILLVTFAEQNRRNNADAKTAARNAAGERLRPVLITRQ
jgi:multidrug efflux pump subunit AcrB